MSKRTTKIQEEKIQAASGSSETAGMSVAQARKIQQALSGIGVGAEDLGWRRMSQDSDRDLAPIAQDRMIEICHHLWKTNALGHWLIETNKDFILGEGVTLTADNPDEDGELQDLLDEFWYDPINNWPLFSEDIVRETGIYGEQCWPAFVNEHTGLVRMSCVDPALIKQVIKDPDNARIPIGVEIKKSLRSQKTRALRIIYTADDAALFTKRTVNLRKSFTDGECFFDAVNKVSTAARGASDLLHLTDWIDGYDQFLFDFAERVQMLNFFVWDVLLKGMDGPAINKWLSENPPPRRGSIRAHNEAVEWNAVAPDTKAAEAGEGARILRNHILGGAGWPEHYYGGGGDVNRSTSESMGLPTFKRLTSRQNRHKYQMEGVVDYQIEQAMRRGRLKGIENPFAYTVNFPEMISKDYVGIAGTITSLASALGIAEQQGWIDKDTARKIFSIPTRLIGVEMNLTELAAKIAEEQEKKDAEDYFKPDPANPAGPQPPGPIQQAAGPRRWRIRPVPKQYRRASNG